jgi:hypothetical protein
MTLKVINLCNLKKKTTKGRDSLLASLLREVATLEPEWPAAATSDRGASQATRES